MTSGLPYIYILGAGHSGSTLLAMLLGMHPRICTVGEVKAPTLSSAAHYRCSCGEPISTCGFWRSVAREVRARGAHLDMASGATDIRRAPTPYVRRLLKPLHRSARLEWLRDSALSLSPAWRRHVEQFQVLNAALARAACTITGTEVFVDSSKTGLQLKYLLASPELDVKVIRLVRDGRGVSLSYRTSEGFSLERAAYAWRRANQEAEAITSSLGPDRWLDLRYEGLCADPQATLRALFEFAGVGPPASLSQSAAGVQHVLGNNKARLNPDQVRLDEKWRRTLTAEDLATFDRVAGPVNRRFGYN
jgi:hypothetical protein